MAPNSRQTPTYARSPSGRQEPVTGLRAGKYELLGRLAAGGMGEVFIARDSEGGPQSSPLALKLLLPHLSEEPEFVQMFLDEARIAAQMHHPNIVQILDLGEADGRYYLAMTLIEGVSLSRLIKAMRARGEQIALPIVRRIGLGLCEGLAFAHDLRGPKGEVRGIVHRDVSPANILLSVQGEVLLTDFGIAKAEGNLHRTGSGEIRGKYAYIAPEQMRPGSVVDLRADLFAAAVTLYEVLTLVSPFARGSESQTLEAVRNAVVPDVTTLRDDVPPAIAHALRACLSREPADRLRSAFELGEAFRSGDVAPPETLRMLLEKCCADQIVRFRAPSADPIEAHGTRSLAVSVRDDSAFATMMVKAVPTDVTQAAPAVLPTQVTSDVAGVTVQYQVDDITQAPTRAIFAAEAGGLPPVPVPAPAGGIARLRERLQGLLSRGPRSGSRLSMAPWMPWAGFGVLTAAGLWLVVASFEAPARHPKASASPEVVEADVEGVQVYEGLDVADEVASALARGSGKGPQDARGGRTVRAAPPAASDQEESSRNRRVRRSSSRVVAGKKGQREAEKVGYLSAEAYPWAIVMLTGKAVQRTPLTRYPLPPGEYWVVLKNPVLRREERRKVRIEEGRAVTLKVDFRK